MKNNEKVSRVTGLMQLCLVVPLFLLAAATTYAQQTTGERCSPSATTTIDGKYVPPPPSPFGGQIGLDASQSKPSWPAKVEPPKGAPNVLLIMTDDAGYGVSGTFGGVIPTPALDRIAKNGPAVYTISLDRALLAHACRAHHRPQSSFGWVRSCR